MSFHPKTLRPILILSSHLRMSYKWSRPRKTLCSYSLIWIRIFHMHRVSLPVTCVYRTCMVMNMRRPCYLRMYSLRGLSSERSIAVPQWVLQRVRFSASPFKFQYLLFSWISSSCWRLLPPLRIPETFLSITCLRRQFLRKMWPIESAFVLLLYVGY